MTNTIAILNTRAPFSHTNAKEALDIALITGTYEIPTSLYFSGDGVWQLINNQKPNELAVKDFLKTFAALEFYDIEEIYVDKSSLEQRGLAANFHIDNVTILDKLSFANSLKQHSIILSF